MLAGFSKFTRGILGRIAFACVSFAAFAAQAEPQKKVINIVVGGRLIELTIPVEGKLPAGKQIILRYGTETIVIKLDDNAPKNIKIP